MSDASLNIEFGTLGANTVRSEIQSVKNAGLEAYGALGKAAENSAAIVVAAQRRAADEMAQAQRRATEAARAAEQERTSLARVEADKRRAIEASAASIVSDAQRRATEAARAAEMERTAIVRSELEKRVAAQVAAQNVVSAAQARAAADREAQAKVIADRELAQARTSAQVLANARANASPVATPGLPSSSEGMNWAQYATGANQTLELLRKVYYVGEDIIQQSAKWEAYAMALKDIEHGAVGASVAMEDLYQLAKAPGVGFEQAEKTYVQLRAVGIEGEKAKRIIKDVANTVALSGGSSVEFERVNRQMVQMLANGRVLETDLRFMKESMPRLATIMQETFGTTSAEGIRKLGVTAQEFVDTMLVGMEKLPKASQTLTSEIENMETAWSMFKASFADTDFWKGAISHMTDLLELVTKFNDSGKRGVKNDAWVAKQYLDSDKTLSGAMGGAQQVRNDQIIRAMQNGMGPRVEAGPLTGFWADEATKAKDAEDKKIAADKAKEEDKKKKKPKEPFDVNASNVDHANMVYNDMAAKRVAFNETHVGTPLRWSSDRMAEDKKATTESDQQAADSVKLLLAEADAEFVRRQKYDEETAKRKEAIKKRNEEEAALLEEKYSTDFEKLNNGLAAEREAILSNTELTEKQRNELMRRYDEAALKQKVAFWNANGSLMLTSSESLFGAMADTAKHALGETSTTYKTMFAISKGFAIADASLKLGSAIMNAAASEPWPANMAAMASVIGATAGVISSINSAAYSGVFDKGGFIPSGHWGIAGENGPEVIQGPAHVTSTKDTARLLAQNSQAQAPVVNVHNYAGASVDVQPRSDGSIDLIIQAAVVAAEESISAGIASGAGKVGNTMQKMYGLRR